MHTNISVLHQRLPNTWRWLIALLTVLAVTLGLAVTAHAAGPCATPTLFFDRWAKAGTLTLPDGSDADALPDMVNIWGYADSAGGTPTVPGPTLTVSEGACVQVTLHNDLGEATSLALHGQGLAADTVGAAVSGGTAVYSFSATQPGTFLYEAGMTPNGARQVAMGLYGALVVQPATAPTIYSSEAVLVLSEIDPALNAAPTSFNMGEYKPRYWLINGKAYPAIPSISAPSGSTLLVRYVNAGLNENSMGLLGVDQELIARDGYTLPITDTYRMVAETIPPGGTMDTLVTAGAEGAQYALYSAAQHLDNDGAAYGGQLLYITVTAPPSDTTGPTTSGVTAAPDPADGTIDVTVSATVDDTSTGGSNIMAAEYFVGPTPGADGAGTAMSATDATFDGVSEGVTGTLLATDVVLLGNGTHTIHVHGQDALGNWGPFTTTTLTVSLPPAPDTTGPATSGLSASPASTTGLAPQAPVTVSATVDDTSTGGSTIMAAEFFIDSVGADGAGTAMTATDTLFDSVSESVTGAIPTPRLILLTPGLHTIYVHGKDAAGNWGPTVSTTFTYAPPAHKHLGDLDSTAANPATAFWNATLTIKVENASHVAVSGATVVILWTPVFPLGTSGAGGLTCTTVATGICTVSRSSIPDGTVSVTATVVTVTGGAGGPGAYNSAYNHDPDAEPNLNVTITGMTIARP